MLSTEEFYVEFDAAGWLKEAKWTPSWGGPLVTARVRFVIDDTPVLGGEQRSRDRSIRHPASALPGIKRGEVIIIDAATTPESSPAWTDFIVRDSPRPTVGDASEVETMLSEVIVGTVA